MRLSWVLLLGLWYYPVQAAKTRALLNSYWRKYIPGTNRRYARGYHYGIDISFGSGLYGAAIRAPRTVKVVHLGRISGLSALGYQIILRYRTSGGEYRFFRICHCKGKRSGLQVGDTVEKGRVVGYVGNSGTSAVHVHFEWSRSTSYRVPRWTDTAKLMNPWKYLEEARKAA